MKLDPSAPIESLLDVLDMTGREFAGRSGLSEQRVSRAKYRRDGVTLRWLRCVLRAAGFDLRLSIVPLDRR